jgi:hypothetical protein
MSYEYSGNGAYCYSNAISMLLSSIGEKKSPSEIEVLTGVGLGAFYFPDQDLLLFSNLVATPDAGITKALEILGFQFLSPLSKNEQRNEPIDDLHRILLNSPAILGPLDMGCLTHNPYYDALKGVDHFVFAYCIKNDEIYFHDPEGFPCVSLPLRTFEIAWKGEGIQYPHDPYQYWASPTRMHEPAKDEIYKSALSYFRSLYIQSKEIANSHGWLVDEEAIMKYSHNMSIARVTSQRETRRMTSFLFPLGARRALDYAKFFAANQSSEISKVKSRQGELFGICQCLAARNDWKHLAGSLEELSETENQFKNLLFS